MRTPNRQDQPLSVLAIARWSPFEGPGSYRQPLVAETLEALLGQGARVRFATNQLTGALKTAVEACTLPRFLHASVLNFSFVPTLARGLSSRTERARWRDLVDARPDLVVAINANALPAAFPLARATGAALVLFDLGGLSLRMGLSSPKLMRMIVSDYWLPSALPLDGYLCVENNTYLRYDTPLGRVPPERRMHTQVPHGVWPKHTRAEAEKLVPVEWRDGPRIAWASRFSDDKRPGLALEIVRNALEHLPDAQFVMAGAPSDEIRARVAADATLRRAVTLVGQVRNDVVPAVFQACDLGLFTGIPSVTNTIFREAVEAAVPIACTHAIEDIFLPLLVDTDSDVVTLDQYDPAGAARRLVAALAEPEKLRAMGRAASASIAARGLHLDDFVLRATRFLTRIARMPRASEPPPG